MLNKRLAIAATLLALMLGKPQGVQANDAELFGTVIGAATGGFIGSNIGSGNGQLAATAAGSLFGAMVGQNIGQTGYYRPYKSNYRAWKFGPNPIHVTPKPRRKYVMHNHRVVVRHVYPKHHYSRHPAHQWKKRNVHWHRYEKRRQRQEERCFYRPSRCGWTN